MSIPVKPLYEWAVRAFHSRFTGDAFSDDFIDAVNDCLDALSYQAALETPIAHIDSTEDEISELDDKHVFILRSGLTFMLTDFGSFQKEGATYYEIAQTRWEEAKANYNAMEMRDFQTTTVDDDDVSEDDVAGIGYKEN